MATKTGGGPRIVNVKHASVDQARSFLETLPEKEKENFSLREAVDKLRDQIQAVLAKGYSYQELSAMLSDKGIKISAATLKNYVPSGRRQAKNKDGSIRLKSKRTRKDQPDEAAIAQPEAQATGKVAASKPIVEEPAFEDETESFTENGTQPVSAPARSTRKRTGSSTRTKTAAKAASQGRAKGTTTQRSSARGRKKAEP
jgi:hypothetical protein